MSLATYSALKSLVLFHRRFDKSKIIVRFFIPLPLPPHFRFRFSFQEILFRFHDLRLLLYSLAFLFILLGRPIQAKVRVACFQELRDAAWPEIEVNLRRFPKEMTLREIPCGMIILVL